MKKRNIGAFTTLALALSIGVSAAAISLNAIDYNASSPRPVLYDNDNVGGNASYDSTRFTATKGSGDTICVWYDNQNQLSVKITLYKYGWFGHKDTVLEFHVDGESADKGEYKASQADSGRYYINITSSDGGDIDGYLRANQVR